MNQDDRPFHEFVEQVLRTAVEVPHPVAGSLLVELLVPLIFSRDVEERHDEIIELFRRLFNLSRLSRENFDNARARLLTHRFKHKGY